MKRPVDQLKGSDGNSQKEGIRMLVSKTVDNVEMVNKLF